jgi:hypothetical protein
VPESEVAAGSKAHWVVLLEPEAGVVVVELLIAKPDG